MVEVKDFEKEAIRLLTAGIVPTTVIEGVLTEAQSIQYEYTGCGYFLTLFHPSLPRERIVCHKPLVLGRSRGIDSGFVVFLQDHHLTLECHSYEKDVPESYREQDVRVTAT
jgi:hypothetical protein